MPGLEPVSGRSPGEAPGAAPSVEEVLGQALARLGRSVGFDAARALAYDPEVLVPVWFVASEPLLDWEHTVAACWNEQAEPDVHKFADLARSRQHVVVMTERSAEAQVFRGRLKSIESLVAMVDSMAESFLKGGMVQKLGLKVLVASAARKGARRRP